MRNGAVAAHNLAMLSFDEEGSSSGVCLHACACCLLISKFAPQVCSRMLQAK